MKLPTFSKNLHKIHYGNQLYPARDWLVLISVAIIILGISTVWNILEFRNITINQVPVSTTASHSTAIDSAAMQQVQKIFSARAGAQAKYESGAYSFTDPS